MAFSHDSQLLGKWGTREPHLPMHWFNGNEAMTGSVTPIDFKVKAVHKQGHHSALVKRACSHYASAKWGQSLNTKACILQAVMPTVICIRPKSVKSYLQCCFCRPLDV